MKVAELLAGPRYSHPVVIHVNLREDPVLCCDGETFSPREVSHSIPVFNSSFLVMFLRGKSRSSVVQIGLVCACETNHFRFEKIQLHP